LPAICAPADVTASSVAPATATSVSFLSIELFSDLIPPRHLNARADNKVPVAGS
jgi:hypothetical protein